ncbi:MAG: RNA polymerase sigma factor [Bacteroidales bacterium]
MQDQELASKLKNGDRDAFRWLVDQYQVKVVNLCNAYLHDIQEAEDIAQDVFVEVFNSIHRFRGDSALATWIYRITVNKALNRKKKLSGITLVNLFSSGNNRNNPSSQERDLVAGAERNPDFELRQEEDKKALQSAVDRLPAPQRTAFLLSQYEQLSYNQIADIMQTSLSAVESLLFRARGNLRKYLASYMEKDY